MLTDIQEQWVQALESGNYKQGTRVLRRDNEYCCLGVFADLQPDYKYAGDRYIKEGYVPCTSMLNIELMNRLGLHDSYGSIKGGLRGSLIDWNDNAKKTFAEIAAYIRAYPSHVFKDVTKSESTEVVCVDGAGRQ